MASLAKTVLILLLVLLTVWLVLRLNSAIDFRTQYLEGSNGEKFVEYRGIRMRQGDFILHYVVPHQVNPVAEALVSQGATTLWMLLYALHGIVGNYIYYLMRIFKGEKSRSSGAKAVARFAARTALAALCGLLCWLLVKPFSGPLGNLIGSWIPTHGSQRAAWTINSVGDGFSFLPILAGIFLGTFYESLEHLLVTVINRLEQPFTRKAT